MEEFNIIPTKVEDDIFNLSYDKNIDVEVEKLLKYYRKHGFPNYSSEDYSLEYELSKLFNLNIDELYDNKIIKQNMTGCGVLWQWFPHWCEVKCNGYKNSLIELWNDDDKLRMVLKKTYKWKLKRGQFTWDTNRIRQNAKVFLAKQTVSNFRPTVAKFIYNKFGNQGNVFDMSCGYGGRFFGFCASNCKKYVGCDPCTLTYNGLIKMSNEIKPFIKNKEYQFYKQGSEIFIPECENKFDLCFTSPPYFNTEKYSDEDTQSWKKYELFEDWSDGFLRDTIFNCWKYLKNEGYMIINIANTKKLNQLESETVKHALNAGFEFLDTLNMELSSIAGEYKKIEPIFIFGKNKKMINLNNNICQEMIF